MSLRLVVSLWLLAFAAKTVSAQNYQSHFRAPKGVNLGGWLNLEDWFYSGSEGRYVMTTSKTGQGACLPPLLPHAEEPWPSEGILVKRLQDRYGEKRAIEIFEAHRHSFVENSDFRKMRQVGVKLVRVALNWVAFAHALAPIAPEIYGAHDPSNESVIVPDPFYVNTSAFVTIPTNWLAEVLTRGHSHGLRFVLDLHSFPGGSSDGTYNGIWPQAPVFWNSSCKVGSTPVSLQTAGMLIVKALIQWVEELHGPAREAVAGLTLMNEPAHMASANGWDPPFARPEQVLNWLGNATQKFMGSELPDRGVKLYMNLIETAFPNGMFYNMTVPWWTGLLDADARHGQAVFDVHWYTAWAGAAGAVGQVPDNVKATCDEPVPRIRRKLRERIRLYAEDFASKVDGLRSCSEFSVGTNQDAALACNDLDVTRAFLDEQVKVMTNYSIDSFFWTWKMPYGPTFERGWSLKVNAGLERGPPPHACSLSPDYTPPTARPHFLAAGGRGWSSPLEVTQKVKAELMQLIFS